MLVPVIHFQRQVTLSPDPENAFSGTLQKWQLHDCPRNSLPVKKFNNFNLNSMKLFPARYLKFLFQLITT
jgi:hypothetical protein